MATVTAEPRTEQPNATGAQPAPRRLPLAWLGVVPFLLYVTVFLLVPTIWLIVGAFQNASGAWTLDNIRELQQPQYAESFKTSIELSLVTAVAGGVFGLLVAYAAVKEGAPGWIRSILITFCGVAANFAGVPLAFAFVATLGITGVMTVFLASHGFNLYQNGFTLFHFTGLAITYVYFQLPLMILIISPSLDGLRREWREAATNLGARPYQYWLYVGGPVLLPAFISALVLLFGNAFSAYATAFALVGGGGLNLVPLQIASQLSGEFSGNTQFADALALGMIVIISIAVSIYAVFARRAARWTQ
jgi:putative spermidine/putrescine transport system permease protein